MLPNDSMLKLMNKLIELKPKYWFEAERNPISKKWIARFSEYPSHNQQHLDEDTVIYLEVGESLDEAIDKIYAQII
jgi:hypothetical protein